MLINHAVHRIDIFEKQDELYNMIKSYCLIAFFQFYYMI